MKTNILFNPHPIIVLPHLLVCMSLVLPRLLTTLVEKMVKDNLGVLCCNKLSMLDFKLTK